uniref:Uncharacterized protein n=1 Tax=Anguilla anguilla TaxID=7936 RepID=A0A0E9TK59_ANGAN
MATSVQESTHEMCFRNTASHCVF